MFLFTKKSPKTFKAGMYLTQEKARELMGMCKAIEKDLHQQVIEIDAFPNTKGNESRRALNHIQQRHSQITKQLGELNLQVSGSTEPWLKEIGDTKVTMERKVMVCNKESGPMRMGWKLSAKQYWPLITETYMIILELLKRLEEEMKPALDDENIWTRTTARVIIRQASVKSCRSRKSIPNSEPKRVLFEKKVKGRYYDITEAPYIEDGHDAAHASRKKNAEFTTNLTNDKKKTAGNYKRRDTTSTVSLGASVETQIGVVREGGYEDTLQDSAAYAFYMG